MGKKLDALLGKTFKASKFKATVNLAVSRLAVLKNQRRGRSSVARSDVVQLIILGHHERALLRVEQVIKEQNMLDVFVLIEGYCLLLIERVNLLEQEKVCPDEMKEAIASLIYAAARIGEFPELQEIRSVFTSRFGKEFTARAVELRNNCGVHAKMIQKLSTRMPSLENRLKVLKEIANDNNIVLQIEEASLESAEEKVDAHEKQNQHKPNPSNKSGEAKHRDDLTTLPDERESPKGFSDLMEGRKYRDVADAAQAAFESAAYAAAAARAAVELSRSESHDPDDPNSPNPRPKKLIGTSESMKSKFQNEEEEDLRMTEDFNVGVIFEKTDPIPNFHSESEDKEMHTENMKESSEQSTQEAESKGSVFAPSFNKNNNRFKGGKLSSGVKDQNKPLEVDVVFDERDDDVTDTNHTLNRNEYMNSKKSKNSIRDENSLTEKYEAGMKEFGPGNLKQHPSEEFKIHGAQNLNSGNKPISVRTRRGHW